jgi:hypothetical protein
MNPTELKMQPTIHLQKKPEYSPRPYPGVVYKCIVGCIFDSVGLIITREIPLYVAKNKCQVLKSTFYIFFKN